MVEVEIRRRAGEIRLVSKTCVRVLGRMPCEGAGLGHGVAHGLGPQIRSARRALACTEVDSHAEATVAVILDGVDLTESYGGREAPMQARIRFRLRCATALRFGERDTHDGLELGNAAAIDFL